MCLLKSLGHCSMYHYTVWDWDTLCPKILATTCDYPPSSSVSAPPTKLRIDPGCQWLIMPNGPFLSSLSSSLNYQCSTTGHVADAQPTCQPNEGSSRRVEEEPVRWAEFSPVLTERKKQRSREHGTPRHPVPWGYLGPLHVYRWSPLIVALMPVLKIGYVSAGKMSCIIPGQKLNVKKWARNTGDVNRIWPWKITRVTV